jgi:hypothetical protein
MVGRAIRLRFPGLRSRPEIVAGEGRAAAPEKMPGGMDFFAKKGRETGLFFTL